MVKTPPDVKTSTSLTFESNRPVATILLVEDESGLREPIRDYLRKQPYEVLEAADGAEALGIAEGRQQLHVLITDVMMPNINGLELAKRLRQRFPEMKVIFMSGYAEDKLGEPEVFQDSALLQKPFPLRSLRNKLQELLTTRLSV